MYVIEWKYSTHGMMTSATVESITEVLEKVRQLLHDAAINITVEWVK